MEFLPWRPSSKGNSAVNPHLCPRPRRTRCNATTITRDQRFFRRNKHPPCQPPNQIRRLTIYCSFVSSRPLICNFYCGFFFDGWPSRTSRGRRLHVKGTAVAHQGARVPSTNIFTPYTLPPPALFPIPTSRNIDTVLPGTIERTSPPNPHASSPPVDPRPPPIAAPPPASLPLRPSSDRSSSSPASSSSPPPPPKKSFFTRCPQLENSSFPSPASGSCPPMVALILVLALSRGIVDPWVALSTSGVVGDDPRVAHAAVPPGLDGVSQEGLLRADHRGLAFGRGAGGGGGGRFSRNVGIAHRGAWFLVCGQNTENNPKKTKKNPSKKQNKTKLKETKSTRNKN